MRKRYPIRRVLALTVLAVVLFLGLLWQGRASIVPPPEEQPLYPPPSGGPLIKVLLGGGQVTQILLEELLPGVVAAEMPASFAEEALKAQAIAARTYILAHSAAYGAPRHDNADICVDSTHCQAYLDTEALRTRWGKNFAQNYLAVCRAVGETSGMAVCYKGVLAETPYCSTCGGRTNSSAEVWGADSPYLRSVECLWDAHSPRSLAAQTLSVQEVRHVLAAPLDALSSMSGQELRQAFALNSANCQWLIDGDKVVFVTRGFGHGVGLCQYGADGLAKTGATAESIINHYYTGVQIETIYTINK